MPARLGRRFPVSRGTGLLAALLLASAGAWAGISRLDAASGPAPVFTFLAWLSGTFLLYGAAATLVLRRNPGGSLAIALLGGVLFRILLLPGGLPPGTRLTEIPATLRADLRGARVVYERFLLYDDDAWRYLWDGHVLANGGNPYLHPPFDPALDELVDAPGRGARPVWGDIRENVNHPNVPTVYPPLAQGLFALAHRLAPGSLLALKLLLVGFDLLAAVFVALALKDLGRPPALVLLYLWNPLVIKAFAGSAHVDGLVVAGLAGTIWLLLRGRRNLAGLAFASAVLAKLLPLVLLPLVARRLGPRGTVVAGLALAAGYAPFLAPGMFDGLVAFGGQWRFNGGIFLALAACLAPFLEQADRVARILCGGAALAWSARVAWLDDGRPESFPAGAASVLGVLLVLGPAVMPWYVTWLVPAATVAGRHLWLCFSGLVCLAFLVMIDGQERPLVLLLEYGVLAALAAPRVPRRAWFWRNQMLKRAPACVVVVLCLAPRPALAQGSGSTGGPNPSSFEVLRSLDGEIESLDQREGVLVLLKEKDGERMRFRIDPKIKLKAERKSELADRKDLTVAEFRAGHLVRVTFRTSDSTAVEMKLRAPKS